MTAAQGGQKEEIPNLEPIHAQEGKEDGKVMQEREQEICGLMVNTSLLIVALEEEIEITQKVY